jgi:hypothetical protein
MPLSWREAMLIADLLPSALSNDMTNHAFELGGKAAGYSASPAELFCEIRGRGRCLILPGTSFSTAGLFEASKLKVCNGFMAFWRDDA